MVVGSDSPWSLSVPKLWVPSSVELRPSVLLWEASCADE